MRWKVVAIAMLLIGCVMLWVYTSMPYIHWVGGFDLTVHVSSDPAPPRSVTCQAFGRREDAELALEYLLPPETRSRSACADPFVGEPLYVHVPAGGTAAMSDRDLYRFHYQYLVVIAVMPDGRQVGKLVDIPDCRVAREVSVVLP